MLAYNVREKAEVDHVFQKAINAGATILKEPEDAFLGGYSWYFSDPEGHSWEIAWNPDFPMD